MQPRQRSIWVTNESPAPACPRPPAPSGRCGHAGNPSPYPACDRLDIGPDKARSGRTWSTGPTWASLRVRSSRLAFPQLELQCSKQKPPAIQNVSRIERHLYLSHALKVGGHRSPCSDVVARFRRAVENRHTGIAWQTITKTRRSVDEVDHRNFGVWRRPHGNQQMANSHPANC